VSSAQHAAVADRFAHEIDRFLSAILVRSRRLSGSPLAGTLIHPDHVYAIINESKRL
jgi:hypothetical protein